MGGSGGGSISEAGPARGSGAGFSDGSGGGVSAPPTEACPETRTALLVDVAAAGSGAYALTLPNGSTLTLAQDGNRFLVAAGGHTLGWLPGDLSRLIQRCTAAGHSYIATLQSVTGLIPNPQIRVVVERN